MICKTAFLSVVLFSATSMALSLPPRFVDEVQAPAAISATEALEIALGRELTNDEHGVIRSAQVELDIIKSRPQLARTIPFTSLDVSIMACALTQANLYLARAGGMGCVDITNDFGKRYTIGGAQYASDMGSLEGGIGLIVYVGPASLPSFVGNYAVGGGMLSIPVPWLKVGPDTKWGGNLDKQFIVFIGGNIGVTGNPMPVRLSGGAMTIQDLDWLDWARSGVKRDWLGRPRQPVETHKQ